MTSGMRALPVALVMLAFAGWVLAVVLLLESARPEPAADLREKARDLTPTVAGGGTPPFAVTAGDFAP